MCGTRGPRKSKGRQRVGASTASGRRESTPRATPHPCPPPQGYLHAGHISLVQVARWVRGRVGGRARKPSPLCPPLCRPKRHPCSLARTLRSLAPRQQCDVVVASIYVNPTQFSRNEDFGVYPRSTDSDLAMLHAAGCAAVFMPRSLYHAGSGSSSSGGGGAAADGAMVVGAEGGAAYDPLAHETWVSVEHLSQGLCARSRPHFFRGVCTVRGGRWGGGWVGGEVGGGGPAAPPPLPDPRVEHLHATPFQPTQLARCAAGCDQALPHR